jgi:nucleoid-associated protein YgaU
MARQAESERERRAKIIAAEGEYQASQRLRQAADRLEIPSAMQLRLFQTLNGIANEQNSTILFPVPIDLFRPYLGQGGASDDGYTRSKPPEERRREESEAERTYEEAVGEVAREVGDELTGEDGEDAIP